jgi:hypothetical protein
MALEGSNLPQHADVERIVRAVLSEMNASNVSGAQPATRNGGVAERTLTLTSKVVSLAEVEGKLKDVSQLIVPRGAVFTPAARDELRKFAVAVASATNGKTNAKVRLVLSAAETSFEPTALAAALAGEGIAVERVATGDLTSAVDTLTRKVVVDKLMAVLITDMPAAAVCLANRQRGVRAALGHSMAAVTEAVNLIAANLLVIDPRSRSLHELKRFTRELVRAGRPERSTVVGERLN